ncbi:MAG TPA: MucB/RseB C-terminal domain-containing protein [Fimbriimonadales bacterium]|nr:MucB/RseB C-terminal domain-containing protein [Fimbriimonadales bacterium]
MKIIAALTAFVAAVPAFCIDAKGLLNKAIAQQPKLVYSGQRTVEMTVGGERRTLVEYVLHSGRRSRTTYPNDSPRRGFVIVETPLARWEYNPKRNEIRKTPPKRDDSLRVLRALVRGAETGRLKLATLGSATVAGILANGVSISDASGNLARKMWIDPDTGLILKAEQFGRVGGRLASFAYTRVNFKPDIRPGDFAPLKRRGAKVVEEEQDFDVPWTVLQPKWLPPNFTEIRRGLRKFNGKPVLLIHYGSGQKNFTLFQSQGAAPHVPENSNGLQMASEAFGDVWVTAVGNVSRETLQQVLQSIRQNGQ